MTKQRKTKGKAKTKQRKGKHKTLNSQRIYRGSASAASHSKDGGFTSIVQDFVDEASGFSVGFLEITHWCNVEKKRPPYLILLLIRVAGLGRLSAGANMAMKLSSSA